MVTRIGHITLHVRDLDAAVDFQREVLGMVETERTAGASYLTCNDRHHELILVADPVRRGYEHVALEVEDRAALERAKRDVAAAGGKILGDVYDGEPGIDRALIVEGPGKHLFKLFCGMQTREPPSAADRPTHFEHVSLKARNTKVLERFLENGLGLRFSDRMGPLASWWHCDGDHHGMAVTWGPRPELSHYAYSCPDLNALGHIADRLLEHRGRKCIWGPSRHGPGNNMFLYFHDEDGAMVECCADLAQMAPAGDYVPRAWPVAPSTINQWGGPPPPRFLLTGYPILPAVAGRPAWAMDERRSMAMA